MRIFYKILISFLFLSNLALANNLKLDKKIENYYNETNIKIEEELKNPSFLTSIKKDKEKSFKIPAYPNLVFYKVENYAYGYDSKDVLGIIVQLNSNNNIEGVIRMYAKDAKTIIAIGYVDEYKSGDNELIFSGIMKFFKDGKLEVESPIYKNKINGSKKVYFYNGNIREDFFYIDGKEEGLSKQYYEDGSLRETLEYKNGKKHGKFIEYFPNGKIKSKANFKDDIPYRKAILYNEDGKVIMTRYF